MYDILRFLRHVLHDLFDTGEPFTTEEFDEMMTAAMDPEKRVVFYDEHAELMALEDDPY